ncbi:hypothetical protein Nepgr_023219 [Nepenthes gracilis]|uniref:Uncharacterized protein n=1 Tax=Nepenthes gracilis TaxID=150966 RepID=A0AAD3T3F8_NEPGR|nr:hypothetical protein Nepgr_023219 [Nepenthes gracilis]
MILLNVNPPLRANFVNLPIYWLPNTTKNHHWSSSLLGLELLVAANNHPALEFPALIFGELKKDIRKSRKKSNYDSEETEAEVILYVGGFAEDVAATTHSKKGVRSSCGGANAQAFDNEIDVTMTDAEATIVEAKVTIAVAEPLFPWGSK